MDIIECLHTMAYRFQEIFRMIIPGLYLLSIITCSYLFSEHTKLSHGDWVELQNIIKNFSTLIVLLIPFVGFVVGYFIECMMSILEHLFYFLGGRRPSKTVLSGSSIYVVHNLNSIVDKLGVKDSLTNKKCKEALQKAKQQIDRTNCLDFLYLSVLARNIFGSQLIITIFLLFQFGWNSKAVFFALPFNIIFLIYWFHKNHVYVKYVFAEYGKMCISDNSGQTQ